MRRILQEAVTVGNATARTVSFAPWPEESFAYYPGSAWFNMLFVGGYEFLDPPPEITADGAVTGPGEGARKLNARTAFFNPYTGITPAMCMRLTGLGSQYLIAMHDSSGEYLDGARGYSPGALSAASFRSNSAREWAITISWAVGVGRRVAVRMAGSVTAISHVGPYLAMISASVGPGGMPGVGRGAANNW